MTQADVAEEIALQRASELARAQMRARGLTARQLFDSMDDSKDGLLSPSELKARMPALLPGVDAAELRALIRYADRGVRRVRGACSRGAVTRHRFASQNDGYITFAEFVARVLRLRDAADEDPEHAL